MDTKHIHCMLEKMAEYGKCMIEEGAGSGNVNLEEAKKIVEMVGELAEAEYHALIAKEMRKANEEDEAEEKYVRKMLKEENKDEYKRMREEYGEDEGERRFYDNYRYADGRFAPKGRGSYRPRSSGRRGRRGYEEPMYFLPPEVYMNYSPEELRDMDRAEGRMYYGGGSYSGNSGGTSGQSGSSGMSGGNSGGNSGSSSRGYSEGYSDGQTKGFDEGQRRGYEDGYRDGESRGRSQGGNRDRREGRSGQSRRSYMETKEMNKGNTPQEKQEKMKELEKYMGELGSDITEMISDASNEEKTMLKSKLQTLVQKIQ